MPALDASKAPVVYANLFQAQGMAEEVVLDFALAEPRHAGEDQAVPTGVRLILGWQTVKRLAEVLAVAVANREKARRPSEAGPASGSQATPGPG